MKHFLYKFLTVFIFLTISMQGAFAKDIRFIQVTDLHFKPEMTSVQTFNKIIDDINSTKKVDFVVFTGDNISQANRDVYKAFLKIATKINVPYYIVLGNHDVFKSAGLSRADYGKLTKKYDKYQKTSKTNFVFKNKGMIFIVLDGAKEAIPGPGGYYRPETLSWLDETLDKYEKDNVVMLQHFPLKQRFTERDAYKIENYQALLKRHPNVIATFSGHFHANEEYIQNGVFHCITGKAFGEDAGYKIVDIVEEINPVSHKKEYKFYTQMVTFE